ncbi:MAG: hypothetical protein AMXMBFR84_06900 [Candidatus Hydrogenedentota bacterium]
MGNTQVALLRTMLDMSTLETVQVAESVPENARFLQIRQGKAHPAWLLGHLANTLNVVVLQWVLEKESVTPKGFNRRFAPDFAGGLPITGEAGDYPAWSEILDTYNGVRTQVMGSMLDLQDEELPNPLKGRVPDPLRSFFDTNISTLMRMIRHDSYHRGQMALLGKSLS